MSKGSRSYTVRFATDKDPHKVMPAVFRDWLASGYIEVIKAKFPRKARVALGFQAYFDQDGNLLIQRERRYLPLGPRIRIMTAVILANAIYSERYCALSETEIARETELQYQPGGQRCAITIGGDLGATVIADWVLAREERRAEERLKDLQRAA